MTTNRPTPEGAWDVSDILEDTASTSLNDATAPSTASVVMGILSNTKENFPMNGDQIAGTIRTIGAMLAGWVVGKGIMPAELWAQIVPVVAGIAVWAWSMWSKKPVPAPKPVEKK